MCPPGCLHAICETARKKGLLKEGHTVGVQEGDGTLCHLLPSPMQMACLADLTHTLHEGFPTMDGSQWFSVEDVARFERDKVNLRRWTLMEHTGTHIDAPIHFSADGLSADLISVGDLVVSAAIIDISARASEDANAVVTPDDVRAWEARNGQLPEGCCVIMNSGWHRLVGTPKFAGRNDDQNHSPGFHVETAQMLIEERSVRGIGVDTLSLDNGSNSASTFPVHYAWLGSGRWGLEALANLDVLPEIGVSLFLGVPKVRGATGGPTRVIAFC